MYEQEITLNNLSRTSDLRNILIWYLGEKLIAGAHIKDMNIPIQPLTLKIAMADML